MFNMREVEIAEGEYYHIFNRGVKKQDIFENERDWSRFLFYILCFQSDVCLKNTSRVIERLVQHRVLHIDRELKDELIDKRYVELVAFCLMPNHFHMIVKEHKEGGIAKYMQRVQNAYTKYYNTKYNKSGHLLQGPYKPVYIQDNEQLLYLSAYIHRNPLDLMKSVQHRVLHKSAEEEYPWSSYQDYLGENRFEGLLVPEVIMEQFTEGGVSAEKAAVAYREAVENSGAKEHDLNFDASLLIDGEWVII